MKTYTPQQTRVRVQSRNVSKHLRIANATEGAEKEKHIAKAVKLANRYRRNLTS